MMMMIFYTLILLHASDAVRDFGLIARPVSDQQNLILVLALVLYVLISVLENPRSIQMTAQNTRLPNANEHPRLPHTAAVLEICNRAHLCMSLKSTGFGRLGHLVLTSNCFV